MQKAWQAVHFAMRILKKGNRDTKSLVYTSLVRPILEYGAACWDPYREGQINVSGRVQSKAAQFTDHSKNSDWETLAQRRKIASALMRTIQSVFSRTGLESYTRRVGKDFLFESGWPCSKN